MGRKGLRGMRRERGEGKGEKLSIKGKG
jgi:hypothetical protein